MFNSLSQCLLKLTSPGVPDIYQGNELWQYNLVDPDNRRPVDYQRRQQLLEELRNFPPQELLTHVNSLTANLDYGRAKLYLTWKTLSIRKSEPGLFRDGCYLPLDVSGEKAEHVVAYAREHAERTAIVVVPRLCATLLSENDLQTVCDERAWGDTAVKISIRGATCYHNVFTAECMPPSCNERGCFLKVANVFRYFPVALLLNEPSPSSDRACREDVP